MREEHLAEGPLIVLVVRDGDGTATSSCIGGPNCGDLSRGGRFKADEGDPIVQSMSLAIGLTIFLVATISVLLHWCRQRRQRMRATTPGIPTIRDPASTAPSLVIAVLNPGDTELSTIAAAHHSQLVLARPSPVACESDSPPVPAAATAAAAAAAAATAAAAEEEREDEPAERRPVVCLLLLPPLVAVPPPLPPVLALPLAAALLL